MATNTSGGTTTSFTNTPQAQDDVYLPGAPQARSAAKALPVNLAGSFSGVIGFPTSRE